MTASQAPRLTGQDRRAIAEARELAAVPAGQIREFTGETDGDLARAIALGRAQVLLGQLADLAARLGGDAAAEADR
jgi:hypothetical protein